MEWGVQQRQEGSSMCHVQYGAHKTPCANFLQANGACCFAHVCDHWVSDQGPKGMCRSEKHSPSQLRQPGRVRRAGCVMVLKAWRPCAAWLNSRVHAHCHMCLLCATI